MKTIVHIWQMICQNKLFYGIYIFGTAIAIATITVLAVIYWNKNAPVYPEYQRDKTFYIDNVKTVNDDYYIQGYLGFEAVTDYLGNLKNATKTSRQYVSWSNFYIQPEDGSANVEAKPLFPDCEFFDIYSFDFLAGRPFDKAMFDSGLPVAVITEETARKAFGATPYEEIIGKDISLNFNTYEVTGIVRSGIPMKQYSFGDIYIPYTALSDYNNQSNNSPWSGNYRLILLSDKPEALTEEVNDVIDRFNNSHDEYTVSLPNGVMSHLQFAFADNNADKPFSIDDFLLRCAMTLLVLMLVPAMNLSGIISGRMDSRLAEMAVRKSFGATRGVLLRHVLWENLCLTLAGGLLGFIFACILLRNGIGELLISTGKGQNLAITAEMMFAPAVFAIVFAVCCILNIMSALVPAYRSLRHPIVESLKEK